MITRRKFITAPVALSALSLPFPTMASAADSRVVIGVSLAPDSLDPTRTDAAIIGEITLGNILEGLTRVNENGTVEPLLATSWSEESDGLSVVFHLRDDVQFHDGAIMDANIVKKSIDRAIKLGKQNKLHETVFRNIADIVVHDSRTLSLKLRQPDPLLAYRLGTSPAVIVHPDSVDQLDQHPIGTGPYMFHSWQAEKSVELQRWPDYRHADNITIERAEFRFMPEPDVQAEAIRTGTVDMLFHMSLQGIDGHNVDQKYQVLLGNTNSKVLIAINNRRAPLNDKRVRQALTHAVDRARFIKHAFGGRGTAIGSHFVPTDPGFINLTSLYPYSPDMAQNLLNEAGVELPLKLTLALPPPPYARMGGPVLAELLAESGIELTVQQLTWHEWLDNVFERADFDLSLIMHVEPFDYHIYTRPDYYFGYDSPEFRRQFQQHNETRNPVKQRELMKAMQRQLAADAVNIWLLTPEMASIAKKDLKGVWMDYPIFAHYLGDMYWL
ncbi:MAG TPA: ABC transporter substrate-binding protein [Burkholderiaceae bacterium]|nr:ABC transporter substrate-binding protein [Burkholderiaceae bacterium]